MGFQGGFSSASRADMAGFPLESFALLGASLFEMNGFGLTITSMTQTGGVASLAIADHGIPLGQRVFIKGAAQAGYNGWKTITGVPDKDHVQFAADSATVSPATLGAGQTVLQLRTDARMPGSAWWQFFAGRLKGFPRLALNAGIGGQTSAQILARVGDAIASGADALCLGNIENDVLWDDNTPAATTIANFIAASELGLSGGMRVLLFGGEPDSDTANTTITVARRKKIQQINAALMSYAHTRPGVTYVDIYSALIDPASANGNAKANSHQPDGVHLSVLGADYWGERVASVLQETITEEDFMPSSRMQVGNGQVFSNPLFQGAGLGSLKIAGTGAWATSLPARVAGTDGDALGNNSVYSSAAAAVGDYVLMGTEDLRAALNGATRLWSIAHVQITGAAKISDLKIGLVAKLGTEHWATALEWWSGMANGARDINLVLRSPELIIPAGATEVAWYVQAGIGSAGAVSIKVGRLGVFAA